MAEPLHGTERNVLPAFDPQWPLLATMLGGVWMGWSWFVFNSIALDGDRRRQLLVTIAVGLGVSSVIAIIIFALLEPTTLDVSYLRYVAIVLAGWKLGISYVLFNGQTRDFQLFEYYGGVGKSGLIAVLAAPFLRGWVLDTLLPFGWWTLVLS